MKNIKNMINESYSFEDIASILGISVRTVFRYKNCNPIEQCHLQRPTRKAEIYQYKNRILTLIQAGYHPSGIPQQLKSEGCSLAISTIRRYVGVIAMENNVNINKGKKGPNLESKKTMEEQISKTVILEYQSKVHIYSLNNKQQFKESLQTAGM